MACNDKGAQRLGEMMREFELDTLAPLATHIYEHSRNATLAQIGRLPAGTYRNALTLDGYDHPIDLVAALTISAGGIHVDFAGTSPVSSFGINVPMLYTVAYTAFGVKCLVAPAIPNNAGSLAPITVSAPEGSILNAPRPCAVAIRHVIGHVLPDVVFGCLHQALAGGAPAEGASACSRFIPAAPVRGRPRMACRRPRFRAACAACRSRSSSRSRRSSCGARNIAPTRAARDEPAADWAR